MATTRRKDRAERRPLVSSDVLLERQPPVDLEAERCVLGSILLKPDVCDELAMFLRGDDFYDDANRKLFTHMLKMHDSGKKIDISYGPRRPGDPASVVSDPSLIRRSFDWTPAYDDLDFIVKTALSWEESLDRRNQFA